MRLSDMFSVARGVCVFAAPGAVVGAIIGLVLTIWFPWWAALVPTAIGGGVSFWFLAKLCVIQ